MFNDKIIKCDQFVDDGGVLTFCNNSYLFNKYIEFQNIKRFYIVQNFQENFIRAWHGHKKEEKYIYVVSGTVLIGLVKIDDWDKPSKKLIPEKYVIKSTIPYILHVPPGYANGFMNLEKDTVVQFFSTFTSEESKKDDYRYDWNYWKDFWDIKRR